MRGGTQGEALADDPALVVVLGVRHRIQPTPYLLESAARGGGELLDGDRVALDEQAQERDQQAGVEAGLLGSVESLGQLRAEVRHCGCLLRDGVGAVWVRVRRSRTASRRRW